MAILDIETRTAERRQRGNSPEQAAESVGALERKLARVAPEQTKSIGERAASAQREQAAATEAAESLLNSLQEFEAAIIEIARRKSLLAHLEGVAAEDLQAEARTILATIEAKFLAPLGTYANPSARLADLAGRIVLQPHAAARAKELRAEVTGRVESLRGQAKARGVNLGALAKALVSSARELSFDKTSFASPEIVALHDTGMLSDFLA